MAKGYWIAHVDVSDAALDCYNSPEYQRATALRKPHAAADIIVIEGYDGPQPADG